MFVGDRYPNLVAAVKGPAQGTMDCKGARCVLGVKALASFARYLGQPCLVIHSDGEAFIVELVRQTCGELPRASKQVTPSTSEGVKRQGGTSIQSCQGHDMSCVPTRYEVETPTGHAAWLLERVQPGEGVLNGYC